MSGLEEARLLLLDDTDSTIQYSGDWNGVSSTPDIDNSGFYGPTYNNTIHQARSNGAKFTLPYNGMDIMVLGTINSTSTSFPNVTCSVDGIRIVSFPLDSIGSNQWPICTSTGVTSGNHELSLSVDSLAAGATFMVDQIGYLSPPTASVNNARLQLHHNDSAISLNPGAWSQVFYPTYLSQYGMTEDVSLASQPGVSSVTLTFQGVSATLYGISPNGTFKDSTCAYSINGSAPTTFVQPGSKNETFAHFNIPLFTTPDLPQGTHTLVVTDGRSTSDTSSSPLTFDFFNIGNGSLPISASSSNGNSSTGISSGSASSKSSSLSGGVIAGIIIGVLALLGICAFLTFFLWRRSRKPKATVDLSGGIGYSPEAAVNAPFTAVPSLTLPGPPEMSSTVTSPSYSYAQPTVYGQVQRLANEPEVGSSSGASSISGYTGVTSVTQKSNKAVVAGSTSERFVEHQDSGLRIANPMEAMKTVDVPPTYSAS